MSNIWNLCIDGWFCRLTFLVCFLCVVIFFNVIALFFLELSVKTIRAPTWCWVPLEKMSKLTINGLSIHPESMSMGHKFRSVCKDCLLITNSQGDLVFLIPSVQLWQVLSCKFPSSPSLGWGLFYYLLIHSGISALFRTLLSFWHWEDSYSYLLPAMPWQSILKVSQGPKIWPVPLGQSRFWWGLTSLGSGFYFILETWFIWNFFITHDFQWSVTHFVVSNSLQTHGL